MPEWEERLQAQSFGGDDIDIEDLTDDEDENAPP